MLPPLSLRGLLVIFAIALASLFGAEHFLVKSSSRGDGAAMRRAAELTGEWFSVVRTLKVERGVWDPHRRATARQWMLGDAYTQITTTLGSRESKLTAGNPAFASLMVRLLHNAGVDSGDAVGVTLSGSFPSLAIATLAAVEAVGARAVLVSSLGASSFGANQPQVTWIDIETWLQHHAGLRDSSVFVTPGAEGDSGGGLPEGGFGFLEQAARRCGVRLTIPESLEEGIRLRTDLFLSRRIAALVNIGGGQTSLGTCPHAPVLPTGYQETLPACSDSGRGVIERLAERGIPVIHLLNIRELAHRYGVPEGESTATDEPPEIFRERTVQRTPLALVVGFVLLIASLRRLAMGGT